MQIVLIDDEPATLGVLTVLLRHLGHQVRQYADPKQALADLPEDTDLVVSDIGMPALDGFDVAETVHAILGNHLPRVLLISAGDYQARLEAYPPSTVIGILPKPIGMADLSRVISLLEQTRTRCPGTLGTFCPHAPGGQEDPGGIARLGGLCFTPAYAACPHYDAECGKALRSSIAPAGGNV